MSAILSGRNIFQGDDMQWVYPGGLTLHVSCDDRPLGEENEIRVRHAILVGARSNHHERAERTFVQASADVLNVHGRTFIRAADTVKSRNYQLKTAP